MSYSEGIRLITEIQERRLISRKESLPKAIKEKVQKVSNVRSSIRNMSSSDISELIKKLEAMR
jgi:hypothetical protein